MHHADLKTANVLLDAEGNAKVGGATRPSERTR
jgi:hypothetical protein